MPTSLAKLYRSPGDLSWIPAAYATDEMLEKFETCTDRAIQEFKILTLQAQSTLGACAAS